MADEQNMDEQMQALKADLAKLRADVADLSLHLQGLAGARVENLRASIQENFRAAGEQVKERLSDAGERGKKVVDDAGESIGHHPFTSVAVALGIGFLLAKLMDLSTRR